VGIEVQRHLVSSVGESGDQVTPPETRLVNEANFGMTPRCDGQEVESNCIAELEQTALLYKKPCA